MFNHDPTAPKNKRDKINKKEVYVDSLPSNFSEQDFRNLFTDIGEIISLNFKKHSSGSKTGFGFVTFETERQAINCIKKYNGTKLLDQFIRVQPSTRTHVSTTNLYIECVPQVWEKQDLQAYFTPFGAVTDCKLLIDKRTGQKTGVGFVHFVNRKDAEQARLKTHGNIPVEGGKPLAVRFARSSSNKTKKNYVRKPRFGTKDYNYAPGHRYKKTRSDDKEGETVDMKNHPYFQQDDINNTSSPHHQFFTLQTLRAQSASNFDGWMGPQDIPTTDAASSTNTLSNPYSTTTSSERTIPEDVPINPYSTTNARKFMKKKLNSVIRTRDLYKNYPTTTTTSTPKPAVVTTDPSAPKQFTPATSPITVNPYSTGTSAHSHYGFSYQPY